MLAHVCYVLSAEIHVPKSLICVRKWREHRLSLDIMVQVLEKVRRRKEMPDKKRGENILAHQVLGLWLLGQTIYLLFWSCLDQNIL